jgi:hydroxymethylpyrimidine/phosphomethylpyrimidine kinase
MLANGLELPEAVREAQDYTWHALQKAYRPGMGQFLPDRLFWARDGEANADPEVDAGEATKSSVQSGAQTSAQSGAQSGDVHRH